MGVRRLAARLAPALGRRVRASLAAAGAGAARAAESLAYRRQELLVVALLATSVIGGFAVDAWHRRAPALLDRLEAEPPRLAAVTRAPASPRPRAAPVARPPARSPAPPDDGPLDLNAATPADLAGLPGIGPRLAARIVARRDELGGRFRSFDEFATTPGLGLRRAGRLRPLAYVPGEGAEAGPPPEPAGVPP